MKKTGVYRASALKTAKTIVQEIIGHVGPLRDLTEEQLRAAMGAAATAAYELGAEHAERVWSS